MFFGRVRREYMCVKGIATIIMGTLTIFWSFQLVLAEPLTPYLVKDIMPLNPGFPTESPNGLTDFNGILYFAADDVEHGLELWRSDGTDVGTYLVKDIYLGKLYSRPSDFKASGQYLYFRANDGSDISLGASELWRTDGTSDGTIKLIDRNPSELTPINDELFFSAEATKSGNGGLWKTDGTPGGTQLIQEFSDAFFPIYPYSLTVLKNTLFFVGGDFATGKELWKSDGTITNTVMVTDMTPGPDSSEITWMAVMDDYLYFATSMAGYDRLWKSDGTSKGTQLLKEFQAGSCNNSYCFYELTPTSSNILYFRIGNTQLWRTDGTTVGTTLVKEVGPGDDGQYHLTEFKGMIYFTGRNRDVLGVDTGIELWRSDGSMVGTQLFKDIFTGTTSSGPADFTIIDQHLYFQTSLQNTEVWRTDGTIIGTTKIDSLTGIRSHYVPSGGNIYFVYDDSQHGPELWAMEQQHQPPVATNDVYGIAEDGVLAVAKPGILANDSPNFVTLKVLQDALHGVTNLLLDGSFTYTPTRNFYGSDRFIYVLSNNSGVTATATVSITVTPVNDAPVATNDNATATQDTTLLISVLSNDQDVDGNPLALTGLTQPAHGSAAIVGNQIAYTPTAGFEGNDSFTYTVSDGQGGTSQGTVTVQVTSSDIDHDGLADTVECPGTPCVDTDGDSHSNPQDIDSDGDGIPDQIENQSAAQVEASASQAAPIDSDGDQTPDYLDSDSDNDTVPDAVEGHDANGDGKADLTPLSQDSDNDGLDDAYDTVSAPASNNASGANVALSDLDQDQKRNWQDADDDGDGVSTAQEGNGDVDQDGIPDYLDSLAGPASRTIYLPVVKR